MSALKDVLSRAQHWPIGAQEELVRAAIVIERNQDSNFDLSADDWKIINARVAAGDVATDAEVAEIFGKFRLA